MLLSTPARRDATLSERSPKAAAARSASAAEALEAIGKRLGRDLGALGDELQGRGCLRELAGRRAAISGGATSWRRTPTSTACGSRRPASRSSRPGPARCRTATTAARRSPPRFPRTRRRSSWSRAARARRGCSHALLADVLVAEQHDQIELRGRERPIAVYEMVQLFTRV